MSQKAKLPLSSVSIASLGKFKEMDKSKYDQVKKPRKVSRSPFDNGLDAIQARFG